MFKKLDFRKKSKSKRVIISNKILLLIMLLLMMFAANSHAQIHNTPDYQITLGRFSGAPGDTAWLPITFVNVPYDTTYEVLVDTLTGETEIVHDSAKIGGFLIRFKYDTLFTGGASDLLTPIIDWIDLQGVVVDTIVVGIDTTFDTTSADTVGYNYKFELVGRGVGAVLRKKVFPYDTSVAHIAAFHEGLQYYADTTAHTMDIRMFPPYYDLNIHEGQPVIDSSGPDGSVVMLVPFRVNPNAQHGQSTEFRLQNGQTRENQFSSWDGLLYILPLLNSGAFTVDTAGANHYPDLNIVGGLNQSATVSVEKQVVVTATDEDGDNICITAANMPSGATFSPSNPVCGDTSTAGTFIWTPNATHNDQSFAITFTADDDRGGVVQSTLNITVGGTPDNNPPVVADIIPNSFTVEQGQTVPTINVSATDPDGDSLQLEAFGLPGNATFVGNPSLYGRGTVSGIFNWLPSFADVGMYTITFQATDSAGLTGTQSIYITVKVPEVDRLFSKSTYGTGTRPTGGIPGSTPVVFPLDLISTRTVYGVNFDMTYPVSIAELDSVVVTDRTPEYVVYDNIGTYPDSVRIVTFGLDNEPIVSGSSTAILNAYFTLDTAAVPGDYWVHLYDAWESVDPDPEIPSLALVVDSGVIQIDMFGDVNLDKHIDVADLVNIVGYIIGNYSLAKRNYETANVVPDSLVNVVDLIGILNLIFGWPINPSPGPSSQSGDFATVGFELDDLEAGQMTKLSVQGEFPEDVAGIQFQIDYDPDAVVFKNPELPDATRSFRLVYKDDWHGRIKVLLYSERPWDSKTLIPAGAADIIQIPMIAQQNINADDDSKIRITRTYLSNGSAGEIPTKGNNVLLPTTFTLHQNYPNPFNPVTRIDFDIGTGDDAATKHVRLNIFNILGRRVQTLIDDDLMSGSHSVIWDATDEHGHGVATGIYLYRLEVEGEHQTKKMLLLK